MSYQVEFPNLNGLLSAMDRMANHPDFSGKVVNAPVRKAVKTCQQAIVRQTPAQSADRAARMRRYPRYKNFPRLRERIGFVFKGASRKKTAFGKTGVNVKSKPRQQAPQGTWTGAGTQQRVTKAGRKTGQIRPMKFVPRAINAIAPGVLSTLQQETQANYLKEASSESGSPFRKG